MKKMMKKAVKIFQGKKVRTLSSVGTSVGIGLAGSAGAGGVILGNGETLVQKVGDAITAIPQGVSTTIKHYINTPEYLRQADSALGYVREQGPEVARELTRAESLLQNGVRQADRATGLFNEGKDYLLPGGEKGVDFQNAYHSFIDGMNQANASIESLSKGKEQAKETMGPAIDALKDIDINPVISALHNLADNFAPDEVAQTLGVAAASILGAYVASQYVGAYWGRRGKPGIIGRYIQRKGLKTFRDYYEEHPEEIAGEEALKIYGNHLLKNPKKLEELVDIEMVRRSLKK